LAAVLTVVLIGALGVAIALACAGGVAAWRARATADDRVAEAVASLAAGMHETMRDLAGALEGAQTSGRRRDSGLPELASSLEVDEVSERTLEQAAAIPGVDAVLVDAAGPDGARLMRTIGMLDEEAAKTAVPIPDNDNVRAVEVTFHYRIDDVESTSPVVRSGVVVPLRADGLPIGSLAAFTRTAAGRLTDLEIDELERLAQRAGPAFENARRYTDARSLADIDALTTVHNRRYFHETLAREVARAHRHHRLLSLIVLDLDNFKAINDKIGHLAGDGVLTEIAERTLSVVRSADITCRVGGDEFAVILPEAGADDASLLAGRIARAIAGRPIAGVGILTVSAGVAEVRPGDTPAELFQRADDALYRAKGSGKGRTVADGDAG
jgi:diguanylate cyclase (GGDEF)-like protein